MKRKRPKKRTVQILPIEDVNPATVLRPGRVVVLAGVHGPQMVCSGLRNGLIRTLWFDTQERLCEGFFKHGLLLMLPEVPPDPRLKTKPLVEPKTEIEVDSTTQEAADAAKDSDNDDS
jgi:uncharacterized protein YodC (DUF2158 family)